MQRLEDVINTAVPFKSFIVGWDTLPRLLCHFYPVSAPEFGCTHHCHDSKGQDTDNYYSEVN